MDDDRASRPPHRSAHRLVVERHQGAQIDDFEVPPLGPGASAASMQTASDGPYVMSVALRPERRTTARPIGSTDAGSSGFHESFDQYSRFGSRKTTGSSEAMDARSSP